jgi:hypothetical protein
MSYTLKPKAVDDQSRLSGGRIPQTELDWSVVSDGHRSAITLHGCDLVRDWTRPSGWKLPSEHRAALHRDLSLLFSELPGEFEVTATWYGDPIDDEINLSRSEFLGRVLANRVANRTLYRIQAHVGAELSPPTGPSGPVPA